MASALADQLQQSPAGVLIVLVFPEMLRQTTDTSRQESYLDFR